MMNIKNMTKTQVCIKINDIFDELNAENKRLNSDLVFAQKILVKLKNVLINVYNKYSDSIDSDDKLVFQQLKIQTLDKINESDGQSLDSPNFRSVIKKESTIEKSNQLIKEKILKKYRNRSLNKVVKSEVKTRQLSIVCVDNQLNSSDVCDEETEILKQKYIKKDNIFDPNTNLFKCPKSDCNKGFHLTEGLYQHLRVVHKMPKIKDNNSYESVNPLNCLDSTTNTYKCPKEDCNKEFATKSRIYRHLTIVHSNKPRLVCKEPNCGKLLKNNNNLRLHMKTHSQIPEPKPFQCDVYNCPFVCRTKHELIQHSRSHSNERPFKCLVDDCDKSFKNMRGLREHSFTHSSEPSLECQYEGCHLLFKTYWNRKNHMNVVHYGKNTNDRPLKPCDWPGCDYTTRFAHQIKKHKRLHTGEKPYQCDWPACDKRFRLLQQLKDHKNIHNNLKPYVCHWPGCHYRCSDSANLRKHVRTSHNGLNQKAHKIDVNFLDNPVICDQLLTIHNT